jgi:hypothetical protein
MTVNLYILSQVWQELEYKMKVCSVTNRVHTELESQQWYTFVIYLQFHVSFMYNELNVTKQQR